MTVRESKRVSFSGWSLTAVVVTMQSGGTFSLYEAWPHALGGLLDSLVADTPLGEQRAHEVGRELARSCRLPRR